MQVGDLVMASGYLGLVICANASETLIKWLDDGEVEDANNYTLHAMTPGPHIEVISESR